MTLFSLVPRLKQHCKNAQAHLFLFWHTLSLLLSAIGIILKSKGKKLCNKNYRSVNFQSFCENLNCYDVAMQTAHALLSLVHLLLLKQLALKKRTSLKYIINSWIK